MTLKKHLAPESLHFQSLLWLFVAFFPLKKSMPTYAVNSIVPVKDDPFWLSTTVYLSEFHEKLVGDILHIHDLFNRLSPKLNSDFTIIFANSRIVRGNHSSNGGFLALLVRCGMSHISTHKHDLDFKKGVIHFFK
jgi:hypothetical protein